MTLIAYLRGFLQSFTGKNQTSIKQRLIEKVAGTFGLRVASTGLAFLTNILLARLLGIAGFGIYTYAFAWVRFLNFPATFGLDNLLVREISIYQTKSNWNLARGILSWTNWVVLLLSGAIALIAIGFAVGFNLYSEPQMLWSFVVAMLMLPIMTLRNLRIAAMQGLHHIVIGLMPEYILSPILIVTLTGGAYLILGENLTAVWAMGMRLVAVAITLVVGIVILNRILPIKIKEATPQYTTQAWVKSALPLAFLGATFVINTQADSLMLGAIQGSEAVGLYLPVSKGAQLINFVTVAANTVLAPTIASLYSTGNRGKLQRVIVKGTRLVFGAAFVLTLGLVIFGRWYLLLFGAEFTAGYYALSILCIGQLVNAATCAVSYLLVMTKYERLTAFSDGGGAILNVVLNAFLIPRWGIEGAAVATSVSLIIVNIINAFFVSKKLNINATVIGNIFGKKI